MSSFTSNPLLETVPGSKEKTVMKPFRYYIIDKHYGPYIYIPYYQKTDGGSIPWLVQPIVGNPWDSKALSAYIVHDRNYRNIGWNVLDIKSFHIIVDDYSDLYPIIQYKDLGNNTVAVQFSRKACDQMLYDGCLVLKKPKTKAFLIHKGVRLLGWWTWLKYARKNPLPLFVLKQLLEDIRYNITV